MVKEGSVYTHAGWGQRCWCKPKGRQQREHNNYTGRIGNIWSFPSFATLCSTQSDLTTDSKSSLLLVQVTWNYCKIQFSLKQWCPKGMLHGVQSLSTRRPGKDYTLWKKLLPFWNEWQVVRLTLNKVLCSLVYCKGV